MADMMKVAVMSDIGKIEYDERPIPIPKDDEALIRLQYVGICGSDMHYFEKGRIGGYVAEPPFVLGHEASGSVVSVGKQVTNIKPGDRVTLEPGKTCGKCRYCREGKYNLCPDVVFFATPPIDGVFQEYVAHRADLCFKLPDSVSYLDGALIEPLSVGFHAANQGGAESGQTAIVFGGGCIGLVSMMALRAKGLTKIYVVDVLSNRLDKAMDIGAYGVIDASKEDVVERANELTGGEGFDLAIETSGAEEAASQAVLALRKGANIVMVGYGSNDVMGLPMNLALDKEVTLKTVFRYRHIYPAAIEAVESGLVDVKNLVTNTFGFADIQNAMDRSIREKNDIIKSVVKIAQEAET
jgi:L-iditol 2-dehydrogenase